MSHRYAYVVYIFEHIALQRHECKLEPHTHNSKKQRAALHIEAESGPNHRFAFSLLLLLFFFCLILWYCLVFWVFNGRSRERETTSR